jgi:hypothetical protein
MIYHSTWLAILLVWLPWLLMAQPLTIQPELGSCSIFPTNNIWNTRIDSLPIHERSDDYVAAIGLDAPVHPDFGAGLWDGGPIGIPFIVVPADQPMIPIEFTAYGDESDPGPYPAPLDAPIEGGSESDGDRHVLVLQQGNCHLYELYRAFPAGDHWEADSAAVYELTSHALRPAGWTSADAAGLPILPGLVRYDEVASGEITHALRMTAPQTQRAYLWPARHYASSITDPNYPPMGLRLRLRTDFPVDDYSPDVQVILRAMQRYGLILADNGSPWFISGAPDERWDNETLRELKELNGYDFVAVDVSSLQVADDSGEAYQPD